MKLLHDILDMLAALLFSLFDALMGAGPDDDHSEDLH
jgi:hypothetical protein